MPDTPAQPRSNDTQNQAHPTDTASAPPTVPPAPLARRGEHVRELHGDRFVDAYEWMRDSSDPEVLRWLTDNNEHAEAVTAHLGDLREQIVAEIGARTQQTDMSVPVRYRGWWYFTRTREGLQYPVSCRLPDEGSGRPVIEPGGEALPGEQVILDGNVEAQGQEFFSVGGNAISEGGELVAFSVDVAGDERYDVRIRRIADGVVVDDAVRGVGYGLLWSADDRYLFYTRVDDAWRSCEVWRHEVGTPADNDVRVFREDDERFFVGISGSSDDRWMIVSSGSKNTSETHLLDLTDPTGPLRCVAPRVEGIEYDVEPAGDVMFVTHNADVADFEVAWAPISATGSEEWTRWLEPSDGERILGVDAFARDVVIVLRSGGFTQLRLVRRVGVAAPDGGVPATATTAPEGQQSWPAAAWRDEPWQIPTAHAAHTIGLSANPDYEAPELLYSYESMTTPSSVMTLDLATREITVLKVRSVLGGFDPDDYVTAQLEATASDGTLVPISLVAHRDTPRDGSAPGICYAYGAYEISMDPWFSIPRLSLLDRGVVWAIAHARGGGEMGRSWYEQGRMENKVNTFTDVEACARELIASGWVAPDRLALEGGSAGGLMAGATVNLDPSLFAVVHADVPFVDTLTTICDPSLPLTVTEWEEWGNPLEDSEVYAYMKSYSPYENVQPVAYPAILATTSLNDTRVSFTEPAKWVARLREVTTGDAPILLRTEMVAGHGGRSGRYNAWEQYAWEESFVLDRLGATKRIPHQQP